MFSLFKLKWFALIFMTLDHIAVFFPTIPVASELRVLGRLAFPLFAFFISEGYFHTKDKRKYLLRLLLFAMVIEMFVIVTQLATFRMNIFFTLAAGLIAITLSRAKGYALLLAPYLFFISYLDLEYGFYGVILILSFSLSKNIGYRALSALVVPTIFIFTQGMASIQYFSVFALLYVIYYDGSLGKKMKYFFYFYYPAHLALLYGLSILRERFL